MRDNMVDNEQLYTAKHYPRKPDKSIDLNNDIPNYIKFSYHEDKGKKREDAFPVPNRRATAESIMIKSDTTLDIKPDHIIVIDGDAYNVSKVDPLRQSTYDLRAVRGLASNETKVMVLDK